MAALFASCDPNADGGGAVETALKFFEARQAFNCGKVWPLYSAGTQENLRGGASPRARARRLAASRDA
jgi:hypothetical protein